MTDTISQIKAENARRVAALAALEQGYDPASGDGACGPRARVTAPDGSVASVPEAMLADAEYRPGMDMAAWERLRCRHDFEFWCWRCVAIRHKIKGRMVPFVLNMPQRRVLAVLERDRLDSRPLRLILLKARQWGGSTLILHYMAWVQMCVKTKWHALICAHVKDTAGTIRGMFAQLLEDYPAELWDGDKPPKLVGFQRSINIQTINGRDCRVSLATAERPQSARGGDYAMAHLSEVAFWGESRKRRPEDLIATIVSSIPDEPMTLVVMESTANGVGNFFHREWLRSREGKGDKRAVFVAWHDIEMYREEVTDVAALWNAMTPYEHGLWQMGLTLEAIAWYHNKARAYSVPERMFAEFPSTDVEAFAHSGCAVFAAAQVEALRRGCRSPLTTGDISAVSVIESAASGPLKVWEYPEPSRQYVVGVDVGGRWAGADYSVVSVLGEGVYGNPPAVVAQWRGHIDHDRLADITMALGHLYNTARVIVESNTLESQAARSPVSVLDRMASAYPNLYHRRAFDATTRADTMRVGFHTNIHTKQLLINTLVEWVRDCRYVERDHDACNELASYIESRPGTFEATQGCHDDIVMSRALAIHALDEANRDYVPLVTPGASGDLSFLTASRW